MTAERALADYFEAAVQARPAKNRLARAKSVANWVAGDLRRLLNAGGQRHRRKPGIAGWPSPNWWNWWRTNTINGKQAKDVLEKAFASGEAPGAIVAREGIAQISDTGELEAAVEAVIAENPKAVEDYQSGQDQRGTIPGRPGDEAHEGPREARRRQSAAAGEAREVLNALGQRIQGFIGRRYTRLDRWNVVGPERGALAASSSTHMSC